MLKRVNIQYSIDLEELPSEVDRIYTNAKNIFNSLSLPEEAGEDILTADMLKKIDETRRALTNLDLILGDVAGIASSYVEYELSLRKGEQQVLPEPQHSAEHVVEMSE